MIESKNIEKHLLKLDSNSLIDKKVAITNLSDISNSEIIKKFIDIYFINPLEIQLSIVKAFIRIKSKQVTNFFLNLLKIKDTPEIIKHEIINYFTKIKEIKSINTIIDLLGSSNRETRLVALSALSEYDETIVNPIVNRLPISPNNDFLRNAIIALCEKLNKSISRKILNFLNSTDKTQFTKVVRIIEDIGCTELYSEISLNFNLSQRMRTYPIYTYMEDHIKQQIISNFDQLCDFSSHQADKLINIIENLDNYDNLQFQNQLYLFISEQSNQRVKEKMIVILGLYHNKNLINIFIELLNDKIPRVRANAVESLMDIGDESVIDNIYPLIHDLNNRVRANAAKALWKFGGIRILEDLDQMLQSEDKWMRISAMYVLGEIGTFQVVDIIINFLADEDPDMRINAIRALSKTDDDQMIEPLVKIINNDLEDWDIRITAINALSNFDFNTVPEIFNSLIKQAKEGSKLHNELLFAVKNSKVMQLEL